MEYIPAEASPSHSSTDSGKGTLASTNSTGSTTIVGYVAGDDHVPGNWQEDTSSCSLCRSRIGALRRHHCRICGRCVCAPCSPSQVQLEGVAKVQRACKACVASALRVPALGQRLGQLSCHLAALCGDRRQISTEVPITLEDAAARCEAVLLPLEEAFREKERRAEKAETELAATGFVMQRLLQSLKTLPCFAEDGDQDDDEVANPSTASSRPRSLQELTDMAVSIDSALSTVRIELETKGRGWGSRTRSRSGGNTARRSSAGPELQRTASYQSNSNRPPAVEGVEAEVEGTDLIITRRSTGDFGDSILGQEKDSNCSSCNSKLGKRFLKPRHHCRICQRCVCAGCSPNSILLDGEKQPVRVCTPCVSETPHLPLLTRRALEIGTRLRSMGGSGDIPLTGSLRLTASGQGMEQALNSCEAALGPLEAVLSLIPVEEKLRDRATTCS